MRAYLRPGIQEGDHFDVEVRVPSRSETTSLRGGWLLPARLTEMAVLGEQIRQGSVLGHAEGPVLVDPSADPKKDPALVTRGRVLGGGVALKSRSLGLVVSRQHQSIRLSQQIAAAINKRFFVHVDGRKQGVAVPKTEEFIELAIHARYKDNVGRYMRVARNIPVDESAQVLAGSPATARTPARRPAHRRQRRDSPRSDRQRPGHRNSHQGARDNDPEVRFYAAEALAYLDRPPPWKRWPPSPATNPPSASMRSPR